VQDFDPKQLIKIAELKNDIERRKKFIDRLTQKQNKQLDSMVDFKNDKDDSYFMAVI
jgi:RNA-binding protein YhbY